MSRVRSVGRNVLRKEGVAKATGTARYVDDLVFPGLLHGRTIRSSISSGEVIGVKFDFDRSGFTIVDHRDIPGRNVVALIDDDQPCLVADAVRHDAEPIRGQTAPPPTADAQPCLVADAVRHAAEPILLLAHENRERLLEVDPQIEYRETTPHFDPDTSPKSFKQIAIDKGNIDRGFAMAYLVVEGEYRVGP